MTCFNLSTCLGRSRIQTGKNALTEGTSVTICDVAFIRGASWRLDDSIVLGFRVSAAGSSPETLVMPDTNKGEEDYQRPDMLPSSRDVLFTIWTGGLAHPRIALRSLKTGAPDWEDRGSPESSASLQVNELLR